MGQTFALVLRSRHWPRLAPLQSCQPPWVLTQSLAFDDPVADKEILISAWLRLARLLIRQLNKREAGRLTLLLAGEDPMTLEIHLAPNRPPGSLAQFQRQLPILLEQPAYTTGIVGLKLQLSALAPAQPRQLSLFDMTQHRYSLNQTIRQWQKPAPASKSVSSKNSKPNQLNQFIGHLSDNSSWQASHIAL